MEGKADAAGQESLLSLERRLKSDTHEKNNKADWSYSGFCSDLEPVYWQEESSEIILKFFGLRSRFTLTPVYQPDCSSDRVAELPFQVFMF